MLKAAAEEEAIERTRNGKEKQGRVKKKDKRLLEMKKMEKQLG